MRLSLGPFITCIVTSLLLMIYVYISIYVRKDVLYHEMKVAFAVIFLILMRMLVPFNFPFTINILSYEILPTIYDFLGQYIISSDFGMVELILLIWVIGMVVKAVGLVIGQLHLWHYLRPFTAHDPGRYPEVERILQKNGMDKLPFCVLPTNISPCIAGLIHPILVLTEESLRDPGLEYICLHEIEHYRNHDLWLKLFLEVVLCVQWFNPIAYILEKKLTLVFELSNDQKVMRELSEIQTVEYAQCIIRTARCRRQTSHRLRVDFQGSKRSDLNVRIRHILQNKSELKKRSLVSILLQYAIVIVLLIGSFLFVPEAYRLGEEIEEAGGFVIKQENAYILKSGEEYKIYVNNEEIFSLPFYPEEFSDLRSLNRRIWNEKETDGSALRFSYDGGNTMHNTCGYRSSSRDRGYTVLRV